MIRLGFVAAYVGFTFECLCLWLFLVAVVKVFCFDLILLITSLISVDFTDFVCRLTLWLCLFELVVCGVR